MLKAATTSLIIMHIQWGKSYEKICKGGENTYDESFPNPTSNQVSRNPLQNENTSQQSSI